MDKVLLFIINPIAGGTYKDELTSTIDSWAKSSDKNIEKWFTTGNNDFKILNEKISTGNYESLIAAGGDGTLQLCATLVKDTEITLGFIPTGSANGMASELDLPMDAEDALAVIEHGYIQKCDMLCFNDSHYGIHISDIGLNAKVVKNFENSELRGFLGYAGGLISELVKIENFDVLLKTPDDTMVKNCYMVAFANASRYGTGALLNNIGRIDDGLFEVCVLERFDLTAIAGQFFDIIDEDSTHMEILQCSEIYLKTKKPVSFQIDGEPQQDLNELSVKIIPSCLNVIVPKPDK